MPGGLGDLRLEQKITALNSSAVPVRPQRPCTILATYQAAGGRHKVSLESAKGMLINRYNPCLQAQTTLSREAIDYPGVCDATSAHCQRG
jgi:hypothetical protein